MARGMIIGGNWKLNGTKETVEQLAQPLASYQGAARVFVAPTALHLAQVAGVLAGSQVGVAAQNCGPALNGAFTGEVSIVAAAELGASWVILGHSERRAIFGEDSEVLGKKLNLAMTESTATVVFCIGETKEDRDADRTMQVLQEQLAPVLAMDAQYWPRLVLAYEPVWAIGTGVTATPELAQATHAELRQWLTEKVGAEVADNVVIMYGGSVKPANAAALAQQADIDGFLVGGASLKSKDFAEIILAANDNI